MPGSVLSASLELTLHNNPMMNVWPGEISNLVMFTMESGAGVQIQMSNSKANCTR